MKWREETFLRECKNKSRKVKKSKKKKRMSTVTIGGGGLNHVYFNGYLKLDKDSVTPIKNRRNGLKGFSMDCLIKSKSESSQQDENDDEFVSSKVDEKLLEQNRKKFTSNDNNSNKEKTICVMCTEKLITKEGITCCLCSGRFHLGCVVQHKELQAEIKKSNSKKDWTCIFCVADGEQDSSSSMKKSKTKTTTKNNQEIPKDPKDDPLNYEEVKNICDALLHSLNLGNHTNPLSDDHHHNHNNNSNTIQNNYSSSPLLSSLDQNNSNDSVYRKNQLSVMLNFWDEHVENRKGGALYISGQPGTGKTLTLSHLLQQKTIFHKGKHILKSSKSSSDDDDSLDEEVEDDSSDKNQPRLNPEQLRKRQEQERKR